ncbi:MAG: DUF1761 domain-containing protein [Lautropia sp.]|nr:DUF1761 domain-containing protein [Lautropia sp.]
MLKAFQAIHTIPILVATLAYYMLGALWFTPLFGHHYDVATGLARAPNQKWAARYYLVPLFSCGLVVLTTALFIEAFAIEGFIDTLLLGLVVGIGYLGALSFNNALTPRIPRPFLFATLISGYHLVGAVLAALIYGWLG